MTTGHWCDECREMYLPDPHKPKRSFEEGMKRLEQLKKESKHSVEDDSLTPKEVDEIFAGIPPATPEIAEKLDF